MRDNTDMKTSYVSDELTHFVGRAKRVIDGQELHQNRRSGAHQCTRIEKVLN
jgi:hypothetical protein